MDEEKKKRLYGGSYDDAISETYNAINNRPAYSYDVNGDALYQQYRDRYTQNARNAMKDTMGQAAALTGGYGNSYAQGVGQQAYDRQMQGLTDMIPTLEQNAYNRYQARGNELQNRYQMLMNLGQAEQNTRQNSYAQLYSLIGSTGYRPTADELAAAGMTQQMADAIYRNYAQQYYATYGRWPAGYQP